MMRRSWILLVLAASLIVPQLARADDPVFSGPQVNEVFPPLTVTSMLGDTAGQEVELIKQADGKPIVLVFVHARTRPAFGLTNLLMRYTATRAKEGLFSGVVFLTDDKTSTEQWIQVVKKHFSPTGVVYGVSNDGPEGPGAYGLNRNMTLTVLVGKEGKVTANFALVQPSIQADGPRILTAIVEATGGGEIPALSELEGMRNQDGPRTRTKPQDQKAEQRDPKLTSLLRAVIDKQATADDVKRAVANVEEYLVENEAIREQLGSITTRVVNSGKLSNYGTEPAQQALRKWAKAYGPPEQQENSDTGRE